MDVSISDLRANLSEWLDRAREGDEVVVTQRGFRWRASSAYGRARCWND